MQALTLLYGSQTYRPPKKKFPSNPSTFEVLDSYYFTAGSNKLHREVGQYFRNGMNGSLHGKDRQRSGVSVGFDGNLAQVRTVCTLYDRDLVFLQVHQETSAGWTER